MHAQNCELRKKPHEGSLCNGLASNQGVDCRKFMDLYNVYSFINIRMAQNFLGPGKSRRDRAHHPIT